MADVYWPIPLGTTLRRREVHELLGGQQQQGISTPAGKPYILIFSELEKGKDFGYDKFEGRRSDGTFAYTGEGRVGNQGLSRGNRALATAAEMGKTIHLFETSGVYATYMGQFTTADPAYEIVPIPDVEGNYRRGLVFNLVPIRAAMEDLPFVDEGALVPISSPWRPPDSTPYPLGPVDFVSTEATRVEFGLQAQFGGWLQRQKHDVKRLRLPSGRNVIEPDIYDATAGFVFEAKATIMRQQVRTAIGQVLDYAHVAEKNELSVMPGIVLPDRPHPDLVSLCAQKDIRLYVPERRSFVDVTR